MNIDRSPGDFRRASSDEEVSGFWARLGHWLRTNLIWWIVGLGLLALLIWAIYPKPAQRRPGFNQGPQPVGVAVAQDGDINVVLNALGTVTPLATATVRPQV